jgi:hypothetical protein
MNNMLINIFSNIFGNACITSFVYKCINNSDKHFSIFLDEYKDFYKGLEVLDIQGYNYLKIRDLFTHDNYFHYDYLMSSLLSIKYLYNNKYFVSNTISIKEIDEIMKYISKLLDKFEILVDKM